MFKKYIEKLNLNNEVYLKIKARPGAVKTELKGVLDGEDGEVLKIDVSAVPEKGKANIELIKYLASAMGVEKNNIRIISGAGDKIKLMKINLLKQND